MFSLVNEVDWEQSSTESYFNFAKRRLDLVIECKTRRNNFFVCACFENKTIILFLLCFEANSTSFFLQYIMFEFCNIFGVSLVSFVVFLVYLFISFVHSFLISFAFETENFENTSNKFRNMMRAYSYNLSSFFIL